MCVFYVLQHLIAKCCSMFMLHPTRAWHNALKNMKQRTTEKRFRIKMIVIICTGCTTRLTLLCASVKLQLSDCCKWKRQQALPISRQVSAVCVQTDESTIACIIYLDIFGISAESPIKY